MTDQPPNDMPQLYALQRAITEGCGPLTRDVHAAIDDLRNFWDAAVQRAQQPAATVRDAARQAAGQTPTTEQCAHCKGSGADPEDDGDYVPEVGRHNPYSGGPCPECHGTGKPAVEQPDPTIADDPTPLRWGLNDVLYGDDDTITVCFSGPDREPYWLELEPEQAAALRDDLTGPEHTCPDGEPCPAHDEPACPTPETHNWGCGCPTDQRPVVEQPAEAQPADPPLTSAERQFLTFALDLAFDRMVSDDGFTNEDDAALARLRRMADEETR